MRSQTNDSLAVRNHAIDGLRALAVVAVIAFHLSSALLPNGFLGVDIFFAISGYVVCSSLLKRPKESIGKFLGDFYSRRLLRIYPPLIACLLITGIASAMFIPDAYVPEKIWWTGFWAFWGLSNFELLARTDSYFGVASEFNPYLHTWSLAIEEQFYFVFPFLVLLFQRLKDLRSRIYKQVAWGGMFLAVAASMFVFYNQSHGAPMVAFYMLPSRYWELGCGALLAALHKERMLLPSNGTRDICFSAIGMIAVFLAIFALPLPVSKPLLAVFGSLMIIQGVADGSASHWIKWLLTRPIWVYLGRISYSLYLWHWPVIVLMRWTVGIESPWMLALACLSTFLLSVMSYHFIEVPFQRVGTRLHTMLEYKAPFKEATRSLFRYFEGISVQTMVLLLGLISILAAQQAYEGLSRSNQLRLSVTTYRPGIATGWHNMDPFVTGSAFDSRRLFIVGDSHAGCYRGLAEMLEKETGLKSVIRTKAGTSFGSLVNPRSESGRVFEQSVLSEMESIAKPGDVVLLSSLRVKRLCSQWSLFDRHEVVQMRDSLEAEEQRKLAVTEGVELIRKLQSLGLKVIIEAPKPILPSPPFRCSDWFNRMNPIAKGGMSIEKDFLLQHRAPAMKSIQEVLEILPETIVWDPFFVLCPGDVFEAFDNQKPLLFDGDHITAYANQKLNPSFKGVLGDIWKPQGLEVSK